MLGPKMAMATDPAANGHGDPVATEACIPSRTRPPTAQATTANANANDGLGDMEAFNHRAIHPPKYSHAHSVSNEARHSDEAQIDAQEETQVEPAMEQVRTMGQAASASSRCCSTSSRTGNS